MNTRTPIFLGHPSRVAPALRPDGLLRPAPVSRSARAAQIRWSIDPNSRRVQMTLGQQELVPGLGHLRLGRLQPEHIEAFLDRKRAAGLSPRTCQYLRAVLRVALNRAIKRKLVAQN